MEIKNLENYVTLSEYAKLNGINHTSSIRRKIDDGKMGTAVKVGSVWLIDKNEPYIDGRVKTGEYTGWRDKYGEPTKEEAIKICMEKNGSSLEVATDEYESGILTINKGRNNVWYIWYLCEFIEWAVDRNGKELSKEDIEKYLE